MGISPISPWSIPLFNTVVLLSSGITLTWAHNAFIGGRSAIIGIVLTLLLALCFVVAQYIEFKEATFSMSDGVFGSLFFFSTGFHGLHVIFGGLFLLHCTVRLSWSHFSPIHCLGFEFSVVYWHFVDVVWLFLYTFVYGWSY